MTEMLRIEGSLRHGIGKGYARKLRKKGLVPAVILGEKQSTILIELAPKWIGKAYRKGKRFLLTLDGSEREVLIQDVQIDPIKRSVVHVDLKFA